MLSTLTTLGHTIWLWLPDLTVGLHAATALLRFCLTVALVVEHLRHRKHPTSKDTSNNPQGPPS